MKSWLFDIHLTTVVAKKIKLWFCPVVHTLLIGLLLLAAAGDLWVAASRGTTRGTAGCMRGGGVAFGGVALASFSSRGFDGVFGADNRSETEQEGIRKPSSTFKKYKFTFSGAICKLSSSPWYFRSLDAAVVLIDIVLMLINFHHKKI